MRKGPPRCVADVEGPWQEPAADTNLIRRCRENWTVPIDALADAVLATFLRQRIAPSITVPEAQRRIGSGHVDGTELYDGELANSVASATGAAPREP